VTKSFLVYPTGVAGVALLLLRLSAAAAITRMISGAWGDWITVAALFATACLIVGLLTRTAAALAAVLAVVSGWKMGDIAGELLVLHAVPIVALAMLGAGAYSLDGYRFGRQVITLRRSD
jgi:uncharacterized membrane protein YphA (DoxX/SURF4 family)